jgi:hypothetical protein
MVFDAAPSALSNPAEPMLLLFLFISLFDPEALPISLL